MIDNPDPSDTIPPTCSICHEHIESMGEALIVEMNIDKQGVLHANQDHLNHAERVSGIAHRACYATWYEETYKTPFTITP